MSESCMTEFVCFRAVRAAGSLVTAGPLEKVPVG